jgi:16S rRNA (cytosine967-C5)-methyltransferase
MSRARDGVSPARACAYLVLRRVFEEGAWADRALHAEAARLELDPRERALATRLAYGAVQRRATLDHVAEKLAGRPAGELDPPVVAALRLGLFQLVFLDRIPAHAAVGEAVELAKADSPGGARLVNAVLRRAAAGEASELVAALTDATPPEAALKHSHPRWIAELWWAALGPDHARALMAAGNRPAESALRANTLRTTTQELAARLPVATRPADPVPDGLVLDEPFDAWSHPAWAQGLYMPQSRAAMAVAHVLDPQPGDRVLDLCAAPGAKTTHIAARMGNQGTVTAVERHPGRAESLRRTARRMGATSVEVRVADASVPQEPEAYDRVLADPPCTDLGTLASRPDARWRKDAGKPAELARLQKAILHAGAEALRPGGRLVYSTCTISPAENEQVVEAFLAERPDFAREDLSASPWGIWDHPSVPDYVQTLPHRDGTEGFFIARLHRAEAT